MLLLVRAGRDGQSFDVPLVRAAQVMTGNLAAAEVASSISVQDGDDDEGSDPMEDGEDDGEGYDDDMEEDDDLLDGGSDGFGEAARTGLQNMQARRLSAVWRKQQLCVNA